jgi:hypothetical protein
MLKKCSHTFAIFKQNAFLLKIKLFASTKVAIPKVPAFGTTISKNPCRGS